VRILIVEDEPVLRKHLARLFARIGCEVVVAGSCALALDELKGARFDSLLVDATLPDGSGLDLLAGLIEHERPLRSLLMSALTTPQVEARARSLRVEKVLRKPLDLEELIEIVCGEGG
jgi:DNA-binding response OmpR family regulator